MLGVSVGCARRISSVHGNPDHRPRRQPVLRLAADQPHARSEGSCLFQAGPGLAGSVVVEPVFGRLTGISVLQIAYPVRSEAGALKLVLLASFNLHKFAEFHHKRLLAEKDILLVDGKGTVLVAPSGGGWTEPVGASIAGSDLLRFAATPRSKAFQEDDRSRGPHAGLGRRPLAFDP